MGYKQPVYGINLQSLYFPPFSLRGVGPRLVPMGPQLTRGVGKPSWQQPGYKARPNDIGRTNKRQGQSKSLFRVAGPVWQGQLHNIRSMIALLNPEGENGIGGTFIKTPEILGVRCAPGCCPSAGTLKFSTTVSGLLSGIISLTVLAVWMAMTHRSSSCETAAQSPPPSGLRASVFRRSLLTVLHLLPHVTVYWGNFSISKDHRLPPSAYHASSCA